MKVKISGAGCSLIDYLYTNIDFNNPRFLKYITRVLGDGGLTPGKLVFADEFERFSNVDLHDALSEITGGKEPETSNLGGPAIVALINAAQLLYGEGVEFNFYGTLADDETGHLILDILSKMPVNIDNYKIVEGETPTTIVLSDPDYHGGSGERTFINNVGAAWDIKPNDLGQDFFDADIVVYGGTGLVPNLHDGLTELCKRARSNNCLTIVNTVFDFRSEKRAPEKRWPLGKNDETYKNINLLIVDMEEGIRMSGTNSPEESLIWFRDKGVDSIIITCGARNFHIYSGGGYFTELEPSIYPVANQVEKDLEDGIVSRGDTTGCGDNFVGGVLASVAEQYGSGGKIDLLEASAWGVASGGQACLYVGGTYMEDRPGQKREKIARYYEHYLQQIGR